MDATSAFSQCVSTSEAGLDLGRAALLIARTEYPEMEIDPYLERLNAIAAEVRRRLYSPYSVTATVTAMNRLLFDELGFSGAVDDYYDPRNSFLNDVLDRKLGIPITLSVLYMEIGRRLDVPLQGVSFPGHFLVKLPLEDHALVLDPFHGGASLDEAQLCERLKGLFKEGKQAAARTLPRLLQGVGKRAILARMLRNLRGIYLRNEDPARALTISNWILTLYPDSASDLHQRAVILDSLECARAAAQDYRHYLELTPQADDYDAVWHRLHVLQGVIARLN